MFVLLGNTLDAEDFECLLNFLVMILGTLYTQQSYKVRDSFPFKWISRKWKEGFCVTSMATVGNQWAVIMSWNAGFSNKVIFLL